MDWSAAVDIYCERTKAGFWAEPVNALSNLSFLVAALVAARGARGAEVWLLVIMAGLIGLGSFAFHTVPNAMTEFADTIPIWSFVAVFVLVAMHRMGGMAWRRVALWGVGVGLAAGVTVVFLASNEAEAGPDPLNGSGQYAPAVVALALFWVFARRKRHAAAPWGAACLGVFLVSLAFRTLDRDICAVFPLGTHYLWHLLNGLMVGLLLQMLIRTTQEDG